MNKKQLAAKIWSGAVALRGNIAASNYKDYMLGLIFYKYLSDKEIKFLKDEFYTEEKIKTLTEDDADVVEQCREKIGYFIPYKNLFSSWIKSWSSDNPDFEITLSDIRASFSGFERLIGDNHKKVFTNIFDTLNKGIDSFGSTDTDKLKALKKLIILINDIPTDGKQQYDVLGFVYEFLLKNFAIKANKGGGEFYTPSEAASIMSEILMDHLKNRKNINIYDPTSGSASLLINIGKKMSKSIGGINNITFYAQEVVKETYNLTRMNLIMHDVDPANIYVRHGDTLKEDWPFFEDDKFDEYRYLAVDGCCSNPPYSQAWTTDGQENDKRFKEYGVAPKGKADLAFLLHNLYHIKDDGIMTIVLPHGVLFRGGTEYDIRKKLVEKGNIDTIIGLPANIFYGTGIPTIIMVLKKSRKTNDILFIDASKGFAKDGNKNKLRQRDIRKIVDTVIKRDKNGIPGYSRLVSLEEIVEKNDYNLNIPRYVDSSDKPINYDLYCTLSGGIPNNEIAEYKKYWEAFPNLKESLFKEINNHLSNLFVENVKSVVYKDEDVKRFIEKFIESINTLPSFLKEKLINKYKEVDVSITEKEIAEKIRLLISSNKLVDFYDSYQLFANVWNDIAFDIEVLQSEGEAAFNKIEEIKEYKKKKNSDELEEIIVDVQGKIFKFEFIQEVCFADKYKELQNVSLSLSQSKSEEDEIYNELDEDGKEQIAKDDEDKEGYDTKKLKNESKRLKEKRDRGETFDEGSYEDIILRLADTKNKTSNLNTKKNKLKKDLNKLTTEKIQTLSPEESFKLLEKKWIEPLIASINKTPTDLLNSFINEINKLNNKYLNPIEELDKNIKADEETLISLINELDTDDDYDKESLKTLKKILEDKNETKN